MQNKNKIIGLFIGNVATAIIHQILEEAIHDENVRKYYEKEFQNSFDIAKKYREKINPIDKPLITADRIQIEERVASKVKNELLIRIEKGYKNIDTSKISIHVEKMLKKLKIK